MNFFRRFKENHALRQLAIFLSVLGPGIVTGSVDNDAGGITTYSVAGAMYGYKLLWTLIPSFIALLTVQEMNARMGVVTGKGLADLIRESFGVRITFYIFIFLLIADVGNTATEFAGVAGSMNIFGVSKYVSVPLAAIAVWVLVLKGNYKLAERVFLLFSVFLLSYVVSAVLAGPDWKVIGKAMITPTIHFDQEYITTVLGIIGTTVAPWMQFYMQSAVIEKKLKVSDYKYTLWDVILGCVATIVVAFNGVKINEAADAAMALQPLAGALAGQLFAFGLFVASIFSAAILPLATAFYVCEAFGFEAGIDKKFSEAPQFYSLFTIIILIGAGIIMIPGAPLIAITIWTQVLNAILLPVVLICMMIIVNNKEIMEEYTNNRMQNIIGWSTTTILILLSAFLLFSGVGVG
jgi:Mn2+/Fe2+ NRAMP family transporter